MDSHVLDSGKVSAQRHGHVDLRQDHRVLRELLYRFEQLDDYYARRDVMQLVVDLFEVHTAIDALVRKDSRELARECAAVYELMEQVESCDAKSQLHYARGLELSRAFEAYVANEESEAAGPILMSLNAQPDHAPLLRERARLMDYAERLLRPH